MTNGQEIQDILGKETVEQEQKRLIEFLGILRVFESDLSAITVAAVNNMGLTVDSFIKQTKIFCTITDDDVANNVILGAAVAGVITSLHRFSPKDIMAISAWMKSKGGIEAGYVEALTVQMEDYSAAIKHIRNKYDGEIKHIRNKYDVGEFYPGSKYEDSPNKGHDSMVLPYGQTYEDRKKTEFIQASEIKVALRRFLKEKVLYLAERSDVEGAECFRSMLALINGEDASTTAAIQAAYDRGLDAACSERPLRTAEAESESASSTAGGGAGEAADRGKRKTRPVRLNL